MLFQLIRGIRRAEVVGLGIRALGNRVLRSDSLRHRLLVEALLARALVPVALAPSTVAHLGVVLEHVACGAFFEGPDTQVLHEVAFIGILTRSPRPCPPAELRQRSARLFEDLAGFFGRNEVEAEGRRSYFAGGRLEIREIH